MQLFAKKLKHVEKNEPRNIFQTIKIITKSFQLQFLHIKNKEGVTLITKFKVIHRMETIPKTHGPDHQEIRTHQLTQLTELKPPILRSEVENACKRIKDGKAAGTVAKMLKAAREPAIIIMHQICNGIWQTGT